MKWTELLPLAVLLLIVSLWFIFGCSSGDHTITGTVVQTEKGYILVTDGGGSAYRLDDNLDMTAMAGKTITATGTLMERTASKSLTITRFEVVGDASATDGGRQSDGEEASD